MYARLRGNDQKHVDAMTLRSIRYIVESRGPNNEIVKKEVAFSKEGTTKEFERAYLEFANNTLPEMKNLDRTLWLENFVIWEPVDGQYIVAACKEVQAEFRED